MVHPQGASVSAPPASMESCAPHQPSLEAKARSSAKTLRFHVTQCPPTGIRWPIRSCCGARIFVPAGRDDGERREAGSRCLGHLLASLLPWVKRRVLASSPEPRESY